MSEPEEEMLNIWSLVGMILTIYGVIITGCGIYYASTGVPKTVMGESNPSLWWGAIILISGLIFYFGGKRKPKGDIKG